MPAPRNALHDALPDLLRQLGRLTANQQPRRLEQHLLALLGDYLVAPTLVLCAFERRVQQRLLVHRGGPSGHAGAAAADSLLAQAAETLPRALAALVERVRADAQPCFKAVEGGGVVCAYPFVHDTRLAGCVLFGRALPPDAALDDTVRSVLTVFGNHHRSLDAGRRDRLTGLLNRQALEDSFEEIASLLADGARPGTPLSNAVMRQSRPSHWVAVVDIDHFKKINDTHGHVIGDEVLLLVANRMETSLRLNDLLCRYGGEEFVAVIATKGQDEALAVLERLRESVASFTFPQVGRVTVSVGVAGIESCPIPGTAVGHADRALYHAKEHGRNQVSCYEALLAAGQFEEVKSGEFELF